LKLIKRFEAFLSEPKEIKYEDFDKILNFLGYFAKKNIGGSSHEIFINKETSIQIVIPRVSGKRVKQWYIKKVIKLLNLRDWFEVNKEILKGRD
jgi:predicted RNA binding protein YcfA (HicA-like mRNA interferase family)